MSKKKKKKVHVTYNQKVFLAPDSINSMSAIFTKIYKNGIAIIRISDCNQTIKLWNDLNEQNQVEEMIIKIETLEKQLGLMKKEVQSKLTF